MPHKDKQERLSCSERNHLRTRDAVRAAKNKPCADCKHSFPYYVMDFDHVRGTKEFEIAQSYHHYGLRRVLAEIIKCDVVCSNCHRIRTYNRKLGIL
jgi:hypothetical protein